MTALLLLMPGTPMLFQGQEFSASSPFLYFADFDRELGAAVQKGPRRVPDPVPEHRRARAAQNARRSRRSRDVRALQARFRASATHHAAAYALHSDLLRLRRDDAGFRLQGPGGVDGAVLSPRRSRSASSRPATATIALVVVNLGADLDAPSFAEPLLAPPADTDWTVRWSSEDPAYGGGGTPETFRRTDGWCIPAECAFVLGPGPSRTLRSVPTLRRTA